MGFVDSIKGVFMSFDDEYDEMVDYPQQEVRAAPQQQVVSKPVQSQYYEDEIVTPIQQRRSQPSNKVMNISQAGVRQSQVATMILRKPSEFDEASEIGDDIKAKKTVFLNLEDTSNDVSKRLLDFLSGVAFAMDGKVEKIAQRTYVFVPHDADLIGENFVNNKSDELESPEFYYN